MYSFSKQTLTCSFKYKLVLLKPMRDLFFTKSSYYCCDLALKIVSDNLKIPSYLQLDKVSCRLAFVLISGSEN